MEKRNVLKNQKGFTLIEIIAVLVILGILAAVAVPKFIDLQADAQEKGVEGALAAVKSQISMDYAQALLDGRANGASWNVGTSGDERPYGEFSGSYQLNGSAVTAEITSAPFTIPTTATSQATFDLW